MFLAPISGKTVLSTDVLDILPTYLCHLQNHKNIYFRFHGFQHFLSQIEYWQIFNIINTGKWDQITGGKKQRKIYQMFDTIPIFFRVDTKNDDYQSENKVGRIGHA